jgi:hypothetical protein
VARHQHRLANIDQDTGADRYVSSACSPPADQIVFDTLGKLYAHGHGIGGYCLVCTTLCLKRRVHS